MTSSETSPARPQLVINADDFGYFPEVTEGISDCVAAGNVTALSILVHEGTQPDLFVAARHLAEAHPVDIGVHLNFSHGKPLTQPLADALKSGHFGSKFSMLRHLALGPVTVEMVEREWDTQIQVVRENGITPAFLNSHEHLHMFPLLYAAFLRLAERHRIRWIRFCTPEWAPRGSSGHWLRTAVFATTSLLSRRPPQFSWGELLGIAPSGRLDLAYLKRQLKTLKPGIVYELMCHPGKGIPALAGNLTRYHDWDAEYACLSRPDTSRIIAEAGAHLTSFTGAHQTHAS
ncbi:MAG: ChbG/HpnK family deacetylase [Verrucomicrobiota bacterium]